MTTSMLVRSMGTWGRRSAMLAVAMLAGHASPIAVAQQSSPPFATQTQQRTPPAQQPPRAPANGVKKDAAEQSEPKAETAADLRRRIDQLEQQLLDMHVIFSSLESLARSNGTRPPSNAPSAPLAGDAGQRLDGLELKITALASQLDRMERQMQVLQQRANVTPLPPVEKQVAVQQPKEPKEGINDLIRAEPKEAPKVQPLPPVSTRPQTVAVDASNARDLYVKAYNHLIRQDYAAAETGFAAFLTDNGEHELAGNAQYWLAETFFVRGQYEQAAQGFLKGYQTFAKSQKAPDSLLKLAMTLDRLGKKEASCATFAQLGQKFPAAPAHLQTRAQSERLRIGC